MRSFRDKTYIPHNKHSIEHMQQLAARRNGKCLSASYINCRTQLLWECEKGHRWMTTPNSVSQGTWCPVCGSRRQGGRLTLADMQWMAEERFNGECLAEEYSTAYTPMPWRCYCGHEWTATPRSIRLGAGCPRCGAGVRRKTRSKARQEGKDSNLPCRKD